MAHRSHLIMSKCLFANVMFTLYCLVDSIQMESVQSIRETFVRSVKANSNEVHDVIFAIKQNNLNRIEEELLKRSTPSSPLYQQWLTYTEIQELTVNFVGAQQIRIWLSNNNLTSTSKSDEHNYIKASASIGVWERLFKTEFYQFNDMSGSGDVKQYNRAQEYSVPDEIHSHITAVFNTVQVPPSLHRRARMKNRAKDAPHPFKTNLRVRQSAVKTSSRKSKNPINKISYSGTDDGDDDDTVADDDDSVEDITPVNVAFLNSLYGIPSNLGNAEHSQAVFETADEYFSPQDLALFQRHYGMADKPAVVEGGHSTTLCTEERDCYEGNLDIQYLAGVAQTTTTIYWYVDSASSRQDPFVVWLSDMSRTANPPKSNSISWGENEIFVSASTMNSFNTEALKLSAMGVTISVSSGDDGVAGDYCSECNTRKSATATNCPCKANSGSTQYHWTGAGWTGKGYFPSFPATSPYVTAVGATMGPETGKPEATCQSDKGGVITSGGGFSTYYARPSWQTDAVSGYFNGLSTAQVPKPGFNPLGRAYPDVSVIGVWYQTVVAAQLVSLFGTSASAPVFAGMISLVNAQRAQHGLSPVGFINPTLYSGSASSFNDVTEGHIKCCSDANDPPTPLCCESGFYAAVGWDPLTGLGSINYPQLYSVLSAVHTPTYKSTSSPTSAPTKAPTTAPTCAPTTTPTQSPTVVSTTAPPSSVHPSEAPSRRPTVPDETVSPSALPSTSPTPLPSTAPSLLPTTIGPTKTPSCSPSLKPTQPTLQPSKRNTASKKLPDNKGYASGH